MSFFQNLSIKNKMTSVIMFTSCIALILACATFIGYELLTFRQATILYVSTLAKITGKNCAIPLTFPGDHAHEAVPILASLEAEDQVLSAWICRDGKIWTNWVRQPHDAPQRLAPHVPTGAQWTNWLAILHTAQKDSVPGPDSYHIDQGTLTLGSIIQNADNGDTIGVIVIRARLDKMYARLRQHIGLVALVLVVASIVAFLLSSRLQGVISRPILELSATARVVTEHKDYAVRARPQGRDEVGTLIQSFNEMLVQIQKRDLELQQARDAAERANQAKSNFLSFMSHELRTPLTAINGFSEMLMTEVEGEGRAEWLDDLRRINDSGKYLLELINDILDISKIEAGKMEVHLETFAVGGLVHDLAEALRPLIEKKANRLTIECDEQAGSMQADLIKVRQCLLNLLSNANKFTDCGAVVLRVTRFERDDTEWLRFRVTDTGIGMTSEQMGKLFRPFTQVDDSASRKYGGTGLGLALTKQFCQIMGGGVTVESAPGRGSTFTIELPARAATRAVALTPPSRAADTPPRAATEPAPGKLAPPLPAPAPVSPTGCILVIDDDPDVHKLIGAALRHEGYRIEFATSGAEGLRRAKELRPAVITLDVIMPEMDGWVVLSLLKADPEVAAIPVIMLTVCAEQDFAFSMGVADYLKKPIERERLLAVIHKYHPPQHPVQVLVVEDDPTMRDMLRRMLERENWEVTEAPNGLAALESITHRRPSLIILDLMMPVMDGFEMLNELQKHDDWRKIPVVVVSAKELSAEERLRLQGHVQTILQKGLFSRDALLREVQATVKMFLAQTG